MRITLSIVAVFGLLVGAPGLAVAKDKAAKVEAEPPPAATPLNPCGCYRDAQDQCHCNKTKKLKCECENDAAAALKRIQQNDKKKQAEARAAQAKKDKEKAAEAKKKAAEGGEGRWK